MAGDMSGMQARNSRSVQPRSRRKSEIGIAAGCGRHRGPAFLSWRRTLAPLAHGASATAIQEHYRRVLSTVAVPD